MISYNIEQKIVPSAFPKINIISKVTRKVESNETPEVIYTRRGITDWRTYTSKCIKPMICYSIGLFESISYGIWNKDESSEEYSNKNLFAIVHDEMKNNTQLFILEFVLCESQEEADKIRSELAKESNIDIEKYYLFSYGTGVNRLTENILNNNIKYIIQVEQHKYISISKDPISDNDIFSCFVQSVLV